MRLPKKIRPQREKNDQNHVALNHFVNDHSACCWQVRALGGDYYDFSCQTNGQFVAAAIGF
jgi:hypothetical protein